MVYVTGMAPNCTDSTCTVNMDFNQEFGLVYEEQSAGAVTTAKSTAPGVPPRYGSRYFSNAFSNTTPDLGIIVSPSLAVTGGVYRVYHTFSGAALNTSTNIVLGVTNIDACTLSFSDTGTNFWRVSGNSTWRLLGYLTNAPDRATPKIKFYYKDGHVSAGASQRLLIDAFRFVYNDPCLDVGVTTVVGPLSASTNVVNVSGVSTNATKITIYQDSGVGMVVIGEKTAGIVAGVNEVTVSGLTKDAQVASTQTIGGVEACKPTTGILVGGGANPAVRVAWSIRENTAIQGPVWGAGPGTNSVIYFLGTSARADAKLFTPSTEWQTVTFQRGVDPAVLWNGTDEGGTLDGDFGVLDGISFVANGTDPGPYDIYIDDISNGTNGVVQDFEAATVGTSGYQLGIPNSSGSTSANLLSAPNVTVVSQETQFSGRNSLRFRWQFTGPETSKWLRLATATAVLNQPGAPRNPMVDLNEPLSFKMLLLPVGVNPVSKVPGAITYTRTGNALMLNWSGSFQLQTATSPAGEWTNVPGVTAAPYSPPTTAAAAFYRLVGTGN